MAPAGLLPDAQSLDERTRNALEAFEVAVRPTGLAAGGSDGEKLRLRSSRLLEKECRGLIHAAEQLLHSVGNLVDCPMLVILLQKLPRLLARQALMIALSDVTPELVDLECLKSQVQQMQQQQLDSTTRYLQELGAARANLRRLAAQKGTTPSKSPSLSPAPSRQGSFTGSTPMETPRPATKKASKQGDTPGRRLSLTLPQDIEEEAPVRSSSSIRSIGRAARKSMTVNAAAGAATAAMAFKRAAPVQGQVENEAGPEFGEVHNYMWDAVEHLDKGLQLIVCKVIAEKMQCFKTQAEATSLAELRALCRRLESYMKGTAAEEHERSMREAQEQLAAKDLEILRLVESTQAQVEAHEEAKKSFLKTRAEQEKLRDSLQRQVLETQAELDAGQQKVEELSYQVTQFKENEMAWQKERSVLRGARKKLLQPPNRGAPGANLQDFFVKLLPQLTLHLAKELKDNTVHQQFLPVTDALQRDWAAAKKKQESLVSSLEASEEGLQTAQARLQQLMLEKEATEEENATVRRRAAQAEQDLVQLQSDFLGQIEKAPAFVALREEFEVLHCEHEEALKRIHELQAEISRRDQDKAQLLGSLEEKEAQIVRLQSEIEEVTNSQLHPTQVAALRAELKRTKHECQALSNANTVLQNSLASLQEQLEQAADGRRGADLIGPEEVSFIGDMCTRNIHNRLYEDAVRRDLSRSQSWAGLQTEKPQTEMRPRSAPVQASEVSSSEPPRSPSLLRQMLESNAQSLKETLQEPLFSQKLRMEPVEAEPGLQQSPSVTPRTHDFVELSSVVGELIANQGRRGVSPASCSPLSTGRWGPLSRFGTESPMTPTPRGRSSPRPFTRGSAIAAAEPAAEPAVEPAPPPAQPGQSQGATVRGILDPREPEPELPAAGMKPRSTSPRVLAHPADRSRNGARSTPLQRRINPRPCPRVAQALLPTVRPRSARPAPVVPFMSTMPARPQSCA